MTIHEILLLGLPIVIGVFSLGLHWILELELRTTALKAVGSFPSKDG